jgi:hypothetical protein
VHPTPVAKSTIACDAQTELVATSSTSGVPLRVRVDPSGFVTEADHQALMRFMLGHRDSQLAVFGAGRQQGRDFSRCGFFRERSLLDPSHPPVPAECDSRPQ